MTDAPSRRAEVLTVLCVYVLPLLAVSGLLALAGLGGLALALLGIEVGVTALTWLVRRRPARPSPQRPSRRPWLVPLAMLLVLGGIVGVAVLGARSG